MKINSATILFSSLLITQVSSAATDQCARYAKMSKQYSLCQSATTSLDQIRKRDKIKVELTGPPAKPQNGVAQSVGKTPPTTQAGGHTVRPTTSTPTAKATTTPQTTLPKPANPQSLIPKSSKPSDDSQFRIQYF